MADVEATLNQYYRSKRVSESTGAPLYGPDLSKWPARVVDAIDVIEVEDINYREAEERSRHQQD